MIRIILIGMKGCGKTTVGTFLSKKLGAPFVELDNEIEKKHANLKNENLPFREIFTRYGKKYFRDLETNTLLELSKKWQEKGFVFACGGGTPLKNKNRKILRNMGKIIFLDVKRNVLLGRILKDGVPSFLPYPNEPKKSLEELLNSRLPVYQELSEFSLTIDKESPEEIINKILATIK